MNRAFSRRRWFTAPRSVGQSAALACLIEASAPKAGNVHPTAAFSDMDFADFLVSSLSIAPVLDSSSQVGVGQTVLSAVRATQQQLNVNTNLGTLLLLVPLAHALNLWHADHPARPTAAELQACIATILARLDATDAVLVYEAIRAAKPGGLGQAREHDVHGSPPRDLLAAMRLAAEVDAVARQYINAFEDVCGWLLSCLRQSLERNDSLLDGVCELQLRVLAKSGDGLIERKVGRAINLEVARLAKVALQEWSELHARGAQWKALDDYLRADGHRRNPGTTADLIAAALFVLLTTDPPRPSSSCKETSDDSR